MNKITTLFKGCQDLYTLCGEVCFQKCGDFTWRVSDCEELVGGFTGDDGVGFSFKARADLVKNPTS